MEKFVVDLDKVLDEFELQEDEAEMQAKIDQPLMSADTSSSEENKSNSDFSNHQSPFVELEAVDVQEKPNLTVSDNEYCPPVENEDKPLLDFDAELSPLTDNSSQQNPEVNFTDNIIDRNDLESLEQQPEAFGEPLTLTQNVEDGNKLSKDEKEPGDEERDKNEPIVTVETVKNDDNELSEADLEKYLEELENEDNLLHETDKMSPPENEETTERYEENRLPEISTSVPTVDENVTETQVELEKSDIDGRPVMNEVVSDADSTRSTVELGPEPIDETNTSNQRSESNDVADCPEGSVQEAENQVSTDETALNEDSLGENETETMENQEVAESEENQSPEIAAENSETGEEQPSEIPEPYSSLTDEERVLGLLKPVWIADEEAPNCMSCTARFTVIRRRHHCRACGRVLCSACCSAKGRLEYLEGKEARICLHCLQILNKVEAYKKWANPTDPPPVLTQGSSISSDSPSSVGSTPMSSPSAHAPARRVNPNNPSEYCSTIPPPLQASASALPPPIMVPVGVLKKEGSSTSGRTRSEPKQVMFSDGIRPGGDLTELDSWRSPGTSTEALALPKRQPKPVVVATTSSGSEKSTGHNYKKIVSSLPPVIGDERNMDSEEQLVEELAQPGKPPVVFAVRIGTDHGVERYLKVSVKLVALNCCVKKTCWCFSTEGLRWVGQDEVLILIEQEVNEAETELLPPADVFSHLTNVYEEASIRRNVVPNMGHTLTPGTFLGSTDHGGFLFFRPSFQCLQSLPLPSPPFLVGVLLQRWEIPWAKVFPLRLLLRLGAEFRYYPCPLFSVRKRKPVYGEVGHTIINLLADMRNFSYSLPGVPGLVVHMKERETSVLIPKSRYQSLCKALAQSNDHVISLSASFSPAADAHLVCLQLDDGSYQTQAINIHSRPRKVTGASFVVFNGALKSSSGLSGRSSIVEDGVMVQLLPDNLEALKQALTKMEDFVIQCGKATANPPEESVTIRWVDQEPTLVNSGVRSPIDGKNLTGVTSVRVLQARDYKGEGHRLLRWTELFFIRNEESAAPRTSDGSEVTKFAETISKASCMALASKMQLLTPQSLIALRVTMDNDMVEYQTGAGEKPLPESCTADLDSSLVPLLHREVAAQGISCVIELWFRILHP